MIDIELTEIQFSTPLSLADYLEQGISDDDIICLQPWRIIEDGQTTAEEAIDSSAAFLTAITCVIGGAASHRGLRFDKEPGNPELLTLEPRDGYFAFLTKAQHGMSERAVKDFLRDPEVGRAAEGAVRFRLLKVNELTAHPK